MKAARLAILGVLLLLGLLVPGVWAGELPEPTGFVNDFAGVLTAEQQAALESRCKALEASHGDELAIAIFQDLPSGYATTKELATALFKHWQVGKKGKDNGVLVVLALGPRRVEIETGYGVEEVLPDQLCGRLLRQQAVPHFKQDDWFGGLDALTQQLAAHLQKGEPYKPSASDWAGEALGMFVFILFIAFWAWFLVLSPIYYWIRGVCCPKCHSRMKRVETGKLSYLYRCPVCGFERRISKKRYKTDYSPLSHSVFGSSGGGGSSFGGFGGGSSGGGGAGASF